LAARVWAHFCGRGRKPFRGTWTDERTVGSWARLVVEGNRMHETITEALLDRAVNGHISCANAHDLAEQLGLSPLEVARAVNKAHLRFYRCQLGLFGYGPKPEGKHKIVLKAARVPEEIEVAIMARSTEGWISCKAAWEVATQFEYPRLGIANILEAMGLKLKKCQLGCF